MGSLRPDCPRFHAGLSLGNWPLHGAVDLPQNAPMVGWSTKLIPHIRDAAWKRKLGDEKPAEGERDPEPAKAEDEINVPKWPADDGEEARRLLGDC